MICDGYVPSRITNGVEVINAESQHELQSLPSLFKLQYQLRRDSNPIRLAYDGDVPRRSLT